MLMMDDNMDGGGDDGVDGSCKYAKKGINHIFYSFNLTHKHVLKWLCIHGMTMNRSVDSEAHAKCHLM